MSTPDTFTVSAPANRAELEAFAQILHQALFFPTLEQYDWSATEGPDNIRLIRLGERVVGGFSVQRMGQWFGGQSIPCGAVRCVGTVPDLRAQGVATQMLSAMLKELHQDGVPIASLYPSTQPIYRRVGFEQAGARVQYMLPTQAIDLRDRQMEMRPTGPDDRATFQRLYQQRMAETAGHLDRNDWFWDGRIFSSRLGAPYYYLICDGDDVQGYLIYTQKFTKDITDGEIHIRDMVLRSAAAARRVWSFFADQRSSMKRVYWSGGTQEPLFLWIPNQCHEIIENWRWLLRIVDVPKALEARGFAPHIDATLQLDVEDPILPANQQRFVCRIKDGHASVSPGGEGHIQVHVRALASIFSGYLSATDAQCTGMIKGEASHLHEMNHAFAGPAPWMPDMF